MFRNFFKPKEQWRLVKTLTESVEQPQMNRTGKAFFHLFESNRGNRRVEFDCSLYVSTKDTMIESLRRLELYQSKIYRWEMGRYDPDIPRYDSIPEEDTANALRGKIE